MVLAMRIGKQQKGGIWAAIGALAVYLFDPILTIVHLNIEVWATKHGYDKYLVGPKLSEFVMTLLDMLWRFWHFIAGDFALGFAAGALIFAFWDPMQRWFGLGLFGKLRVGRVDVLRYDLLSPLLVGIRLQATLHNDSATDEMYVSIVGDGLSIDGQVNPEAHANTQPFAIQPRASQTFGFAGIPGLQKKNNTWRGTILFYGMDQLLIA